MKRLSKFHLARRDELSAALCGALETLNREITEYNTAIAERWEAIDVALGNYNEQIADANAWQEEVQGEIESFMDNPDAAEHSYFTCADCDENR